MNLNASFEPSEPDFNLPPHNNPGGFPPSITEGEFNQLLHAGAIADGRLGGLVLGRSEAPIYPIFKLGDEYIIGVPMEPNSFLVNWEAAARKLDRLKKMISGLTQNEEPDDPPRELVTYVLANAYPTNRIVWINWGQAIIGPEATQRHIAELIEINQFVCPYWRCNLHRLLNCAPAVKPNVEFDADDTVDGIV